VKHIVCGYFLRFHKPDVYLKSICSIAKAKEHLVDGGQALAW
jgi:hypothetical protein